MKETPMLLVPALALIATAPAQASEFKALKEEIATARKALVTMALYRDKRGPEQQKLVKDTADAVSARLARTKAPAGKPAEFKELKATWEAFKKTREEELVPAILAGDQAKSDKIGAGIQKTRLERMYTLIDAMEK